MIDPRLQTSGWVARVLVRVHVLIRIRSFNKCIKCVSSHCLMFSSVDVCMYECMHVCVCSCVHMCVYVGSIAFITGINNENADGRRLRAFEIPCTVLCTLCIVQTIIFLSHSLFFFSLFVTFFSSFVYLSFLASI
jgi:hypothetical protein